MIDNDIDGIIDHVCNLILSVTNKCVGPSTDHVFKCKIHVILLLYIRVLVKC